MTTRKPGRDGQIRIGDHSLEHVGINKGDLVVVHLTEPPSQDELCAAFTAWGELVVRYFYRKENGDVRLSVKAPDEVFQVFAPSALAIMGRVTAITTATPT